MDKEHLFSKEFIDASMRLRALYDALDSLESARIKHKCHVGLFKELMHRAATGDDIAVQALEYAIRVAARQIRLSIMARPCWKKMMEDIQFKRNRVKKMRTLTYQALYPFATKKFE